MPKFDKARLPRNGGDVEPWAETPTGRYSMRSGRFIPNDSPYGQGPDPDLTFFGGRDFFGANDTTSDQDSSVFTAGVFAQPRKRWP